MSKALREDHKQLAVMMERSGSSFGGALSGDASPGSFQARIAGEFSLMCLCVCLVMLLFSSLAYPGGSWADKGAEGFHPLVNYWCDLMRTEAVNGLPNATSASLAKIAFGALAASLSVYWWVAASLLPSSRLARWGIASGVLASVCVALLIVFPYDTQRWPHVVTPLSAGGFGFVATVFIMVGSLRSETIARWRHVWGAALVVVTIVNIVVYADIVLPRVRQLKP